MLFAALNTLDGTVISMCEPRHRHEEWLKFLKLIDRKTPKHLSLHEPPRILRRLLRLRMEP